MGNVKILRKSLATAKGAGPIARSLEWVNNLGSSLVEVPRMTRPARTSRAFTLIELLVVISVIAVLISLLLPALGKARETSRRTKCLANMHSIGQSLQLYMDQESKGLLPKVRPLNSGSNPNDPSLLDVMSKYIDAAIPYRSDSNDPNSDWIVADPWKCPSDASLFRRSGTSWEYPPAAFMLAAEIFLVPVDNIQAATSKAYEIHPTKLLLVMDADDWHNPRFDVNNRDQDNMGAEAKWNRNGLFYGDLHAEVAPFPTQDDAAAVLADIVRLGGHI
jgi:prepilin-type N-terminal cleavage/methylation domain-containing protein